MKHNLKLVGNAVPRHDAIAKARGEQLYSDDWAMPNMLYGKVLRSKYPAAILKGIDISKAKALPAVDKDKKTVTVYSGSQKLLVTFIVPDQYLSLPASAWDAGDIVRIYFKDDGKALRVMNVSKTNIFKK